MSISAVLACRNEEPFIQAWLEETSAYAHEILIAVNAPTDRTADLIARFKTHSPVPIHCEWFPAETVAARYGFAMMKNEMISRATGDWVTSIDADEEIGLTPEELERALDSAAAAGRSALSLLWVEHACPERLASDVTMDQRATLRLSHTSPARPEPKCKVFRNREGFWWRGFVHEKLARQGRPASEFSHDTGALLHHYAYLRRPLPQWKKPLYSYLICRGRDCPHLKPDINVPWYERRFATDEEGLRAEAAAFEARRHAWFPETPRRDL